MIKSTIKIKNVPPLGAPVLNLNLFLTLNLFR